MATYARRGDRYRVRWRDPGVLNPKSYSVPDEQTAKELAAEASRCEARGEPWVPPPDRIAPLVRRALETLVIEWLGEVRRTARPSTVSAYADSMGRFVEHTAAHLGRVPVLADLTPDAVRRWDAHQIETGKSVFTRRARFAAISSMANWLEAEHPDEFRKAPVQAVKMPPGPKAKPLALTWDEVDAIVSCMGGVGHVAAVIQRCTGLRRGEVVMLRWGDLDVTSAGTFLDLPDDVTKGGRAGRRVPLAPVLARFLSERRSSLKKAHADEDRIAPITRESYTAMTSLAIGEAVGRGRCRSDAVKVRSSTHLFRKAFVSNLRRAGADADAVEHLVGHDIGVRSHYLDLDELMRAAVRMVPNLPLGGNAEGRVVAITTPRLGR